MSKKKILLKLTGTALVDSTTGKFTRVLIESLASQIKRLAQYQFGIVIGGGSFFRGARDNGNLYLRSSIAHTIGMLGTTMNGLMIYDIFHANDINSTLLCGLNCPKAGDPCSQQNIDKALAQESTIIFSGGIGEPFVTTDVNAVIRALQMETHEIWKATDVDGVYTGDPHQDAQAKLLKNISFKDTLEKELQVMDQEALKLAQEHDMTIRIFNIFKEDAINQVIHNTQFGTTITKT